MAIELERGFHDRTDIRICVHVGASGLGCGPRGARLEAKLHERLLHMFDLHDIVEAVALRIGHGARALCRLTCAALEILSHGALAGRLHIDEQLAVAHECELIRRTPLDREQPVVQQFVMTVADQDQVRVIVIAAVRLKLDVMTRKVARGTA
ncbi:MAG TPA: hypothetical protein VIV40_17275, partial [Kofleriaceae bacterium]